MGPLAARLPPGTAAGKALGKVASSEARFNTPTGGDGCERLKDEVALADLRVRNGEPPRSKFATTPQGEIQIEHARAPVAATSPAEVPFDRFQMPQHR